MSVQSKTCVHSLVIMYTGLGKCRLKVARSQTLKVKISRKNITLNSWISLETSQIDFVLKISSGRREIINHVEIKKHLKSFYNRIFIRLKSNRKVASECWCVYHRFNICECKTTGYFKQEVERSFQNFQNILSQPQPGGSEPKPNKAKSTELSQHQHKEW